MDNNNVLGESSTPSSTSSCITEAVVKRSHEFKITGYSSLKGIGSGNYLASDTFSVGGHDWVIYFYPDGKNPDDNATYVSLFIVLASHHSEDVKALFELTLLDQSGNERHKVHTQFHIMPQTGPYMLKNCGSMWGYKRFLQKTILETSDYLKDDCLYVNCSVGVVPTP